LFYWHLTNILFGGASDYRPFFVLLNVVFHSATSNGLFFIGFPPHCSSWLSSRTVLRVTTPLVTYSPFPGFFRAADKNFLCRFHSWRKVPPNFFFLTVHLFLPFSGSCGDELLVWVFPRPSLPYIRLNYARGVTPAGFSFSDLSLLFLFFSWFELGLMSSFIFLPFDAGDLLLCPPRPFLLWSSGEQTVSLSNRPVEPGFWFTRACDRFFIVPPPLFFRFFKLNPDPPLFSGPPGGGPLRKFADCEASPLLDSFSLFSRRGPSFV